jgi:hypothetical protein
MDGGEAEQKPTPRANRCYLTGLPVSLDWCDDGFRVDERLFYQRADSLRRHIAIGGRLIPYPPGPPALVWR